MDHGHETHGHSTTVSAGHGHRVEEGKGIYRSGHHKLFTMFWAGGGVFLAAIMTFRDLQVLQRSLDHGHEEGHGHRKADSSGHGHRREKEESEGTFKAESRGSGSDT